MAAPGSAAPRKFSEKIALQRQRQAEETAAFVEVMSDLSSARVQVQKLRMAHMRGSGYGGSLPNVNQIGSSSSSEFQGPPQSPLDPSRTNRHHGLVERVHRDPRRMMSPLRRYMRQVDSSPYNAAYLSPHHENNWRRTAPWGSHPSDPAQLFRLPSALNRTNSDSALHTSVMNPSSQEPYPPGPQGAPTRRSAFPFPTPAIEESDGGGHLLKPCDAKRPPSASGRPKSCEVPGINIYPSLDPPPSAPPVNSVLNTGGSLPDLTSLHFPSPLHTPLDPEESGFGSLSGGSSTGNLASTMTHLGISRGGGGGLPPAFDSSGFSSDLQTSLSRQSLQSSLSRQSLQSSLSNPNLQASLRGASLHTSFSNPSLQSSLSSQSLPSSFSNQSLSPSASSHSLAYSTPSSPSSSSSSFPPMAPSSLNASPHRRVPLSPLTLPMTGDGRRPHQKQFSPTMSPTLTSITQGVPLDTSKMAADQRLPPYHFNHPNMLHQSAQHMSQSQQYLHQSQEGMGSSQQHQLHQSQQEMGSSLHQSQQGGMGNSQLHQSQQGGMGNSQLHQSQQGGMGNSQLHQSQQGMERSQQHLHQSQQGMGSSQQHQSQQHLHQSQQGGMGNSQQHLHQSQQGGMGNSQQHLHQSQQGMGSSQLHQSPGPQSPQHAYPKQSLNQQLIIDTSQKALQQISYKDFSGLESDIQNFSYQQNSGGLYQPFLGDYQLSNSLLSSLFDECDLRFSPQRSGTFSQQLEPYNGREGPMEESPYGNCGGGATRKQNSGNCYRHDPIPNIILTAVDSPPPGFSKEITTALSSVPGFEGDPTLGLEDDLNIEPLTLDGLNMLSDPYAPLTDPLVEDSFRSDRLH